MAGSVGQGLVGDSRLCMYLVVLFTRKVASTDPWAGPKEIVSLRDLPVQSSNWFGISLVQFSSIGTNLPGKFVQFSSRHRGQVPPFSLFSPVHSVQFTNSSGPGRHRDKMNGTVQCLLNIRTNVRLRLQVPSLLNNTWVRERKKTAGPHQASSKDPVRSSAGL